MYAIEYNCDPHFIQCVWVREWRNAATVCGLRGGGGSSGAEGCTCVNVGEINGMYICFIKFETIE